MRSGRCTTRFLDRTTPPRGDGEACGPLRTAGARGDARPGGDEEGSAVSRGVRQRPSWLFNVQNGTLDLRTGELREHHNGDLLPIFPRQNGAGRRPPLSSKAPRLSMAATGEDQLLRRAAGYTLSGDMREQVFLFLHGPEAAGKGTYTRALSDVMGSYSRSTEIGTFLTARRDTVRNDIASLVGARLVTASEPEDGQAFDEGLIKILTGQDRTTARFLFREAFEFSATFKLWLQGNHRPHIRSTGGAMWRRLLIVPFTRTVPEEERDKLLGEKLRSPEERAGIRLTESWAMLPGASVSGYYFWHPRSAYFGVGRIGRDQLEDYARRAGIPVAEAARILAPNLADDAAG